MPALLAEADEVVKLWAICARCGRDASRSQRLIDGKPAPAFAPTILVGAPRKATRLIADTATKCRATPVRVEADQITLSEPGR